MSQPRASAQNSLLVSDVSIRDALRRELHRSIHIEKRFSRGGLASESGVSTDLIDAILSRDPAKHRRLKMDDVFSIISVLGTRAVCSLLSLIAHGAYPLDETGEPDCSGILAESMGHLATLARAFADGRIDESEAEEVREAADGIVDTVIPISSRKVQA